MLARGRKEAEQRTALHGCLTAKTGSPLFGGKQAGSQDD